MTLPLKIFLHHNTSTSDQVSRVQTSSFFQLDFQLSKA